jgi:hypothetical protein
VAPRINLTRHPNRRSAVVIAVVVAAFSMPLMERPGNGGRGLLVDRQAAAVRSR